MFLRNWMAPGHDVAAAIIAKSRAASDTRWMESLLAWLLEGNPGTEQRRPELAARLSEYSPQFKSPAAIPEKPVAQQPG
jgi:hypothetical protein